LTAQHWPSLFRRLAPPTDAIGDGELLRRFATDGDAEAFGQLVQRHGRLVWAACRHLTSSDAEADDSFQATFVVLLRQARKIRQPGKLPAWLYGVAVKVCSKARQASKRRCTRETKVARHESNGSVVPDSAWDRAQAAVIEEVAKLPETYRVPFILCGLEGLPAGEAAVLLGCKLGTLSGRLTRAKDLLLTRLERRGVALGAAAGLAMLSASRAPAAAMNAATALAQPGTAIPGSILQLAHGVLSMSLTQVKLLAAGVMLACGFGLTFVGDGRGTVQAQAPAEAPKAKATEDAKKQLERLKAEEAELKKKIDELNKSIADKANQLSLVFEFETTKPQPKVEPKPEPKPGEAWIEQKPGAATGLAFVATAEPANKWEYDFVPAKELDKPLFVKLLYGREKDGWEFVGTVTTKEGSNWLFRRSSQKIKMLFSPETKPKPQGSEGTATLTLKQDETATQKAKAAGKDSKTEQKDVPTSIAILELQIDELNTLLNVAKAQAKPKFEQAVFEPQGSKAHEIFAIASSAIEQKFGKGKGRVQYDKVEGKITVEGPPELIACAKKLMDLYGESAKKPQ